MIKEYSLKKLKPGMVTVEDVKTRTGQTIVKKNVTLTSQLISRMGFYSIPSAIVEVSEDDIDLSADEAEVMEVPVQAISHELSYSQKVIRSEKFQGFQLEYSKVLATIKSSFEGFVYKGNNLDVDLLLKEVKALYQSCKTSLDLFDMLHNMRSIDDSVHAHCLNVALISRRFGRWLKMSPEDLDVLTLSGLLHDIGKLNIPNEILNKPGKYTPAEFGLVKQHTSFGYELLRHLPIDARIKKAALSHHERCDKSGYPLGIGQEDTDDFALIIAIVDVYDAMTAARSYRAPLCPFQVIAKFEDEGLSKYKPQYILTFLQHIANTYQNNRVILSNGHSANIVMLNDKHLAKPIVQLEDGTCIDLAKDTSIQIQALK